jgi:hypothetical protein
MNFHPATTQSSSHETIAIVSAWGEHLEIKSRQGLGHEYDVGRMALLA